MAHTIEDKIIELADKYTLNHSNESYLNNKTMLEEFQEYVKSEMYYYDAGVRYVVGIVSDIINKPENDYLVLQELKETILKLKNNRCE